jgi:hypothetical protein
MVRVKKITNQAYDIYINKIFILRTQIGLAGFKLTTFSTSSLFFYLFILTFKLF